MLFQGFLLPSISLLSKLKEGKLGSIKIGNLLRGNGSNFQNAILLFDWMYLQKCTEYSGRESSGLNSEQGFLKSVISFLIVVLEQNIPCLIKAVTVFKPKSFWLKREILNLIKFLMDNNFFVWATVCDNHALNISVFSRLLLEYWHTGSLFIEKVPRKIYLFYDSSSITSGAACWIKRGLFFHHLILADITTIFMPHHRKFL